ncbi:hypothetical protein [Chloroflexus sp.]
MKGYIYRITPATAAQVRDLITRYVSLPCWHFSGSHMWDLSPSSSQHLRPLVKSTNITDITLSGDFGHAFSPQAEVRWKRLGDDEYDVLILSEQARTVNGAQTLVDGWEVRQHTPRRLLQSGNRPSIEYLTYHAPNGAAQFIRYVQG